MNVVHNGIKRAIRVALDNECYAAAVILVYSGIDTMAYIGIPDNQEDVTSRDFMNWADQYIRFPCNEQVTGADLYGARCGMLHSYSVTSRLSREGKCRRVGYMDKAVPEVRYDPGIDPSFVLVSIHGLAEAFFRGIDQFLVDIFADPVKAAVAERRLDQLVMEIPYSSPPPGASGT